MKHVLSIAFAQSNKNFDEIVEFNGEKVRLTQYATGFDFELAKDLIRRFDGLCDVISISGVPPKIKTSKSSYEHFQSKELKSIAKITRVVDGQKLKDIYIPWAFRQFYLTNKNKFKAKRIGVYTGALQKSLVQILEELDGKVCLADPYTFLRLPYNLHSNIELEKFLSKLSPVFSRMKIKKTSLASFSQSESKHNKGLKEFFKSDIFVGNEGMIQIIDRDHLAGKTVVLDFMGSQMKKKLVKDGIHDVITCMPKVVKGRYVNFSVLEGLMQSFQSEDLTADLLLKWVDKLDLKVEYHKLNVEAENSGKKKFAFIIHPLSKGHLFKHPLLRKARPIEAQLGPFVEKAMAYTPGFYYGSIKGIRSEKNNEEIEGLIYSVAETPKMLLSQEPDKVYKKLIDLCVDAAHHSAQIIGLGAFTKIVGDAGITVEQKSPIPVTTGNSLSACSTLWAAKFAIDKLGFVESENSIRKGTAMVVGATGAIGAVSAKILATKWERVILVAPRAYKLLELKDEVLKVAPHCEIEISTHADGLSHECDLIITTTSAQGKKILDIEKVKPGCVICDVSRPFDISEDDAMKRPDVMVIASGEVQLPGEINSNVDLGLEGNIVYACLAETALLAMAGKFESFTLGRNISYEKVLEIDLLAKEHGVRLSAIMGHNGFITDEEFELCRAHALKKR
ncbi:hypothetical protein [Halobacteriovorax sp. HLS]|uniref:hypothetical protein n=1 Tax=Halobacteriovorax sp. HLS TaxID=2234000 RepID=UPI000FDC8A7A|nr:hypothetical protein [Halobacteriovorax sp. HLS]